MHKGQSRWTRLSDELCQRRGIERARQQPGRKDKQPPQLPEPEPPRRRTSRRRRSH